MAVGRSRKNKETGQWENDPQPLFLDCEAWTYPDGGGPGRLVMEHCRKGKEVYIGGVLVLDSWNDKTTGDKRQKHKLKVLEIQFLGSANDSGGGDEGGGYGGERQQPRSGGYGGGGGYGSGRGGYGGGTGGAYVPPDHGNNPPQTEGDDSIPF